MDVKDIVSYFNNLDETRINQGVGVYLPTGPCCVGAHLANMMSMKTKMFHAGMNALAAHLGGNVAQVVLMLMDAGAGEDPFGEVEWPDPPHEVFARLSQVESLPETRGADLSHVTLIGADLVGADLRGADLSNVLASNVLLDNSILDGARMHFARAHCGRFRHSSMVGVDTHKSTFESALFNEADMSGMHDVKSSFHGAEFYGANLSGAIFERSIFHAAALNNAMVGGAFVDGSWRETSFKDCLPTAFFNETPIRNQSRNAILQGESA